jgi:hypothetical protein
MFVLYLVICVFFKSDLIYSILHGSFVCKTYKAKKQFCLGKENFEDFSGTRCLKITDSDLYNEMAAYSGFMTRT